MTGERENPPQKVGTPAADLLAGEDAALATVAALFRRQRSGKGCAIDVAMIESMSRFMGPRLLPFLGSGELPRRSGGRDSVIAIYQAFDTADEPITLGLGNDPIFARFWQAVGDPEVARDPAFASNSQRREAREELVARIAAILRQRGREEWLELLRTARVPAGPINRLDQVAADSELRRRGFLYQFERGGVAVPQVGLGIGFDGASEGSGLPPPRLGEHNHEIFASWLGLGFDEAELLQRQLAEEQR